MEAGKLSSQMKTLARVPVPPWDTFHVPRTVPGALEWRPKAQGMSPATKGLTLYLGNT